MKKLVDEKNELQAKRIELAEKDFASGTTEKERDRLLHMMDMMSYTDVYIKEDVLSCSRRLLRSFY